MDNDILLSPTLQKALLEVAFNETEIIYNRAIKSNISVSKECDQRVIKSISKHKRRIWLSRFYNTAAKRAAVIVVAFLLTLFTVVMSVEALRLPVIKFFTDIFTTHSDITTQVEDSNIPTIIEKHMVPAYIPNGYEITEETYNDAGTSIIYENDNGIYIAFDQRLPDTEVALNTENTELIDIKVGMYDGKALSNLGINTIYWSDGNYIYYIAGSVSTDDLVKMGISLEAVQQSIP